MSMIVFVSPRQTRFVDWSAKYFHGRMKILLSSREEVRQLPQGHLDNFDEVFYIENYFFDGIMYEYDRKELFSLVDLLGERFGATVEVIVCFDEANVENAIALRKRVSAHFIDCVSPSLFRDKLSMKKALEKEGVRVPRNLPLPKDGSLSYEEASSALHERLVVKPVSSAGTNSVFIIENETDYSLCLDLLAEKRISFEVEEYVSGCLYHCDIIVLHGVPIFVGCMEYAFPPHMFQKNKPLGGRVVNNKSSVYHELREFSLRALSCLGGVNGSYHMEIFYSEGELIFLECAARPPGLFVTEAYKMAYGLNILNLDIEIRLGILSCIELADFQDAFYMIYPIGDGVVSRISYPPSAPGVTISSHPKISVGDVCNGCRSNVDFSFLILASGGEEAVENYWNEMKEFVPVDYSKSKF
ncbi:MAG: ATP-grasp domain-containing protein [Lautropia sp.]|nr:ATP-grasp domain-containing protein [Lautropia sp.]